MSSKTTIILSSTLLLNTIAQDFPYLVTADGFPQTRPDKRYTPYNSLSAADQATAQTLGYTPITWNVHGLAPIEKLGWWQFSDAQKNAATSLGFTESAWDCFINHYLTYTWDELTTQGLTTYLETLGWTSENWEGDGESPSTESKWWGQLSSEEKESARNLCYFQDNWNQIDMTPNYSFMPFPFPEFRYKPWMELTGTEQNVAEMALGYTGGESWDNLGNNTAELNTFLNLDETKRMGAMELGFYTHTWDCYMNHYDAYYWDSLYGSLLVAVQTLGWTEDMWNTRESYPDSEATYWDDLTPQERAAAAALCFFKESWDGQELSSFYDYTTGQTKAIPSTSEVPADMDFSIFAGQGAPGSDWVPGQIKKRAEVQQSSSSVRGVSVCVTALAVVVGAFLSV